MGVVKGDTRSLEYSSYRIFTRGRGLGGWGSRVYRKFKFEAFRVLGLRIYGLRRGYGKEHRNCDSIEIYKN